MLSAFCWLQTDDIAPIAKVGCMGCLYVAVMSCKVKVRGGHGCLAHVNTDGCQMLVVRAEKAVDMVSTSCMRVALIGGCLQMC
eukprot:1605292-Amphidinium_carterae.1